MKMIRPMWTDKLDGYTIDTGRWGWTEVESKSSLGSPIHSGHKRPLKNWCPTQKNDQKQDNQRNPFENNTQTIDENPSNGNGGSGSSVFGSIDPGSRRDTLEDFESLIDHPESGLCLGSPTIAGSFSSTTSICSSMSHIIDKNYNFELSSHEVYMSDIESYAGQFTETRQKLDKSFHGFYRKDRQLVQDQIVSYVLRSSGSMKRQGQPWIIFTAGAMGSGKSHTLNYLKKLKEFRTLESFVLIDQDEIRSLLPEWSEYVKKSSRKAASLLQKESGYMSEIALYESLSASRNIIFDSSLRDYKWWKLELQRIREEYPQYRVAILYIRTDLETSIRRTEARALKTGRIVPLQSVVESFEQSAESFRQLESSAHLTAVIDSSFEQPTFIKPSMEEFLNQWRDDHH